MKKTASVALDPAIALDDEKLREFIAAQYKIPAASQWEIRKLRQSVDARKKNVIINLDLEIYIDEKPEPIQGTIRDYPDVSKSKHQVVIAGAGPAGLFAALRLIELGVKPIILERGKDVQSRRRDLAAINKDHVVNPESNYCFGEGGAGTYSDGKLYTRSKKRGDIRRVLEILVAHGSTEQILVDAHPHIGTNKLPVVVANLRNQVLKSGGEVHFDTKIVDFVIQNGEMKGVITANGKEFSGLGVILATGHSARDIFELLHQKAIYLEPKPFAMGVRIEHSQGFVDQCQYHRPDRGLLPAASYSLVAQTHFKGVQRGVFSFCMCPGGFIVPSSTAPGELVVNGMSPSRRDSVYANSGVVVAMNEVDWKGYEKYGALAALEFQKEVEQKAWRLMYDQKKTITDQGTDLQYMPAQRIGDFIKGKISPQLNETSYQPGLISMDMMEVLPSNIGMPLKDGIIEFGKKMQGYASNNGQLIGIESRTSSPVRIPRDKENLEHVSTKRLYPCGEGAGYAGGIVSAAMDGERCAEALVTKYV